MLRASLSRVWRGYVRVLDSRPLLTQALTTGFICSLGDVIAQTCMEDRGWKTYSLRRTCNMGAIGLLFTGPVLRTWFLSLEKIFGPSTTMVIALKKVLADQVLFAPLLVGTLIPLFGLTQGMGREQIKEKIRKEYLNMLFACYKLWPAAQIINFYFIPLKFRVNFANLVSLFWNTYVAWLANRPVNR